MFRLNLFFLLLVFFLPSNIFADSRLDRDSAHDLIKKKQPSSLRKQADLLQNEPGSHQEKNNTTPTQVKPTKKVVEKKKKISLPEQKNASANVTPKPFVRVYSNESAFVEPIGVAEKQMVVIPIDKMMRLRLKEEISNMNYGHPAMFEVLSQDKDLQGATFVGNFRALKQQKDRIFVDLTSVMLKDGTEFKVEGYVVDTTDDKPGLAAVVDNKVGTNLLKILGDTATALAAAATDTVSHGTVGRFLDSTTTKKLNDLEIEAVVTAKKNSMAFLKLSKPITFPKYR